MEYDVIVVGGGPSRLMACISASGAGASVLLVERSSVMADCARKTLSLPENVALAPRVTVLEADVTSRGRARLASGLADDVHDHVIMNPPFNDPADRTTPDVLKAEAHAMADGLFEGWIRTAGAVLKSGGQLSLIARPQSIAEIIAACGRRFGGLEITVVHPRPAADATRLLVTAVKGSRARLLFRAPLFLHGGEGHAFTPEADALNNGRSAISRRGPPRR